MRAENDQTFHAGRKKPPRGREVLAVPTPGGIELDHPCMRAIKDCRFEIVVCELNDVAVLIVQTAIYGKQPCCKH
jgi:hypothetical protein